MSAVVGMVDFTPGLNLAGQLPILERMTTALQHRGIGSVGLWARGPAALGQRGSLGGAGSQPYCRTLAGHTYWLVLDGMLTNRDALLADCRGPLEPGAQDDADILLAAWCLWGAAMVQRLEGAFALALWDETVQTLFLARDALGLRTLYYHEQPQQLLFASQPAALLAHPQVSSRMQAAQAARLLCPSLRAGSSNFFSDLEELPAGCALSFDASGCQMTRYFCLQAHPAVPFEPARWTVPEGVMPIQIQSLHAQPAWNTTVQGQLDGWALAQRMVDATLCEELPDVAWTDCYLLEAVRALPPQVETLALGAEWPLLCSGESAVLPAPYFDFLHKPALLCDYVAQGVAAKLQLEQRQRAAATQLRRDCPLHPTDPAPLQQLRRRRYRLLCQEAPLFFQRLERLTGRNLLPMGWSPDAAQAFYDHSEAFPALSAPSPSLPSAVQSAFHGELLRQAQCITRRADARLWGLLDPIRVRDGLKQAQKSGQSAFVCALLALHWFLEQHHVALEI